MSNEGLEHGDNASEAAFDIGIFLLDGLLGTKDGLEFLVGLLARELVDAALKSLDLVLSAFADGALGLAVWGVSVSDWCFVVRGLLLCVGRWGQSRQRFNTGS